MASGGNLLIQNGGLWWSTWNLLGKPEVAVANVPPGGDQDAPEFKSTDTEQIPNAEAQIDNIVALTLQQLKNRYAAPEEFLRGVHAKDHGCVKAVVDVEANLQAEYRVGAFSQPGAHYDALIRFSNASTLVLPDNGTDPSGKTVFGSRGIGDQSLGVEGDTVAGDGRR